MAPKFALFTKGSKLPLNKGFKNMFELHSLALNPRCILIFSEAILAHFLPILVTTSRLINANWSRLTRNTDDNTLNCR